MRMVVQSKQLNGSWQWCRSWRVKVKTSVRPHCSQAFCIFSLKVRKTAASREFSCGVARWVSDIVGRPLTFKDVARRAAMTRLANELSLSVQEKAKYFGVATRTMAVYHRMQRETPVTAARSLSTFTKEEKQQNAKRQKTKVEEAASSSVQASVAPATECLPPVAREEPDPAYAPPMRNRRNICFLHRPLSQAIVRRAQRWQRARQTRDRRCNLWWKYGMS